MLNSVMLDNVMARFGNRRSPALRATVLYELNRKIDQLEQSDLIPWFLETRWTASSTPPAVTVPNQEYLDLPTNFLRECEEGQFKVLNVNVSPNSWLALVKVSLEDLEKETENAPAQIPVAYALFGNQVIFGPTPNAAYNLKLPYYARSTVGSTAILDNAVEATNPWIINFYNYITLQTIDMVARTHIQADEIVQRISGDLQEAQDHFWRAVEARQHVNRDYLLDNSES